MAKITHEGVDYDIPDDMLKQFQVDPWEEHDLEDWEVELLEEAGIKKPADMEGMTLKDLFDQENSEALLAILTRMKVRVFFVDE